MTTTKPSLLRALTLTDAIALLVGTVISGCAIQIEGHRGRVYAEHAPPDKDFAFALMNGYDTTPQSLHLRCANGALHNKQQAISPLSFCSTGFL